MSLAGDPVQRGAIFGACAALLLFEAALNQEDFTRYLRVVRCLGVFAWFEWFNISGSGLAQLKASFRI